MTTIHAEVWLAAAMLHEAGHPTFPPARLVEEVERRFGDVRPGVKTHVHAHCVASAPKNTMAPYNYLIRTDSGDYRLHRAGDTVHPSRVGYRTQPNQADVPEQHRDLWRRWLGGVAGNRLQPETEGGEGLLASVAGASNSSITRVRPVFTYLFSADPTGREWLPDLWSLAAAKRPSTATVPTPAIFGSLISDEVTRPRRYTDRVLARHGDHELELPAAFERRLAPPDEFLAWLLQHPGSLAKPVNGFGSSDTTEQMRKGLLGADPDESKRIMQLALQELTVHGVARSDRAWWAFEGFSEIDCCLVTPSTVLFIEGKRTESVSSSTKWYPTRHQLWRNVEVAAQFAGTRQFGVVLAVEDEVQGHLELAGALTAVGASYPHLSPGRQAELARHLIGFVTWSELQAQFDIPAWCLPDTTTEWLQLMAR